MVRARFTKYFPGCNVLLYNFFFIQPQSVEEVFVSLFSFLVEVFSQGAGVPTGLTFISGALNTLATITSRERNHSPHKGKHSPHTFKLYLWTILNWQGVLSQCIVSHGIVTKIVFCLLLFH